MGTGPSYDWIFLASGWTVAAFAAALVLWALFWDRSRGRRRCPKCWYEMTGVPGLLCPECGRTAKDERRLFRTRRRRRWAALGLLLCLAGIVTARLPSFRQQGWIGQVPTTVLVFIAPTTTPRSPALPAGLAYTTVNGVVTMTNGVLTPGGIIQPRPPTTGERLNIEAWRRLTEGRMARWQSTIFLRRCFAADPKMRPERLVQLPVRWPAQTPIAFAGASLAGLGLDVRLPGGQWLDATRIGEYNVGHWVFWLKPGVKPTASLELDVRLTSVVNGAVVYADRVSTPTVVGSDVSTFLERVYSSRHNELVRDALRPRLVRREGQLVMLYEERSKSNAWREIPFAVAFTVELRSGGVVVARGSGAADWSDNVWDWDLSVPLTPEGGADLTTLEPPLELVIRGDPRAAGELYMAHPFVRPSARCWTGELVVPVERIEDQKSPPR